MTWILLVLSWVPMNVGSHFFPLNNHRTYNPGIFRYPDESSYLSTIIWFWFSQNRKLVHIFFVSSPSSLSFSLFLSLSLSLNLFLYISIFLCISIYSGEERNIRTPSKEVYNPYNICTLWNNAAICEKFTNIYYILYIIYYLIYIILIKWYEIKKLETIRTKIIPI